MAPDIITIARTWSADLIVRESLDVAGCAAAEVLGLSHASVGAEAGSAVDRRVQLAAPLAALRKAVGLPEDPTGAMLYRYLHLCFCPPTFDGLDAPFPPNTHFLQHRNPPRPGERLPSWFGELPSRPIVLATLGTVFHRTPGVFEAIVQRCAMNPSRSSPALVATRTRRAWGLNHPICIWSGTFRRHCCFLTARRSSPMAGSTA
jgi:UDP:flavonoid glycosyltransferase YjiC (YdhE family)